jgi:quercetin dioxygenase-like cupin family protein
LENLIVPPAAGKTVDLGGLGVVFKVFGEDTGGALSIVEHPMAPRRLVPPHAHRAEDELSYVLEGTFGVRIGDLVAEAGPGSYVYKPKGVLHTFWNPTDRPARLIEIIVPAGFERFFAALGDLDPSAGTPEDRQHQREALGEDYGLSFSPEWVAELKARYGLKLLGEP